MDRVNPHASPGVAIAARGTVLTFLCATLFAGGCQGSGGGGNPNDKGAGNDNVTENENQNQNQNGNQNSIANMNVNGNDNTNANVNANANDNQNENDNIAVNQPPTAKVGADRKVTHGASVTLSGTGSSDPNDDTLTYLWTQTAGATVTLNDDDTAAPSFTAPTADATLTFELRVEDGRGESATDALNVDVVPPTQPQLLVANMDGNSVIRFENIVTLEGNVPPSLHLSGQTTTLKAPTDVVLNAAGELIVSNINSETITIFAAGADGDLAPSKSVFGDETLITDPLTLAIDTDADLLFVGDSSNDDILVFEGTQQSFGGNAAPDRIIDSLDVSNPFGMNFASDGSLYIANNNLDSVAVFVDPGALDGPVASDRLIASPVFESLYDVYVDANDTMYVLDQFDSEIYIFNGASTLDGAVTPDFTLDVAPAADNSITAIAVDLNGIGYIVDARAGAIYVYDNIGTLDGSLGPDRTIAGSTTRLITPIRVFLIE